MYAVLTVFVFPETFKKDDKAVASYAFPLYLIGTSLLFIGMFFCAFITERSSKEYYLRPEKPSKIYWVQPGNQDVGDQVFNAYLAVKEDSNEYIKSVRDRRFDRKYLEIYSTLGSTLLGFILQFVGLRGLHASVILAQLGSTFLMAVIRTCLRTERMAPGENKMIDERELTSHKQQELDCFAFHLENLDSFDLVPIPGQAASMSLSSIASGIDRPSANQIIQTRVQLARLTSDSNQSLNVNWDDMPIRQVARKLAQAIESTMDLLSSWGVELGTKFSFELAFECVKLSSLDKTESAGTYSIGLMRCGDVLRWKIDANELEAVLGLWVWSLQKSNDDLHSSTFCRLVGLDEAEASLEETYLYFHKWIFRQTEARVVKSGLTGDANRLFIPVPKDDQSEKTVLTVRTKSPLENMAAQDIFVHFFKQAASNLTLLGGETDIIPGIHGSFFSTNTHINHLVSGIEDSGIGTREDALLCIVPVLKKFGHLPALIGDYPLVQTRIQGLVERGEWKTAFELLRWLCERSSGSEFDLSTFRLAYLCRQAMMSDSPAARSEGADQTCRLIKSDVRDEFFLTRGSYLPSSWTKSPCRVAWWSVFCIQLGWVALEITKGNPDMRSTHDFLKNEGIREQLYNLKDQCETEDLLRSRQTFKSFLMGDSLAYDEVFLSYDEDLLSSDEDESPEEDDDALCFGWATQNCHGALLYFMVKRVIELSAQLQDLIPLAYSSGAHHRCHFVIQFLLRSNMDINTINSSNLSALTDCVIRADLEGARMLLEYGANINGGDKTGESTPLIAAIEMEHIDLLELLLQHGASPNTLGKQGLPVMWWASRCGNIEVVDMLLRHGGDINTNQTEEKTPLMFAAAEEQLDMLSFLIAKGADIDARDSQGHTAVMCAAVDAHPQVLEMLITGGANVQLQNDQGLTALDMAKGKEESLRAAQQYEPRTSLIAIEPAKNKHARCLQVIAILQNCTKDGRRSDLMRILLE